MSFFHSTLSSAWAGLNRVARRIRSSSRTRYPFRTIVVGNIEAGGTGKTPITAELARNAISQGRTVVILIRGYKSRSENSITVIAPNESASALKIGDEAALLRELAPGAWMGVGSNRRRVLEKVAERLCSEGKKPELVLLDDGLQQFWLEPSDRVICLSGAEWGDSVFFRERFSEIQDTDFVILTKAESFPSSLKSSGVKKIRVEWELPNPPERERGYLLVHGVGRPETVKPAFVKAGWKIEAEVAHPDHADYDSVTVERLLNQAKTRGLGVVTTGKDAVKWKALGISKDRFLTAEPLLKVVEGRDAWNSLLARV